MLRIGHCAHIWPACARRGVGAAASSSNPWAAADADGGTWPLWAEYLDLEGDGDPWRTRVLFERLLAPGETDLASRGGGPRFLHAMWTLYEHC